MTIYEMNRMMLVVDVGFSMVVCYSFAHFSNGVPWWSFGISYRCYMPQEIARFVVVGNEGMLVSFSLAFLIDHDCA